MKKRNIVILTLLALASATSTQAASFTYSAGVANNLVGFNGEALTTNDSVEIGTYVNDTFTSIHLGTPVDPNGAGFFAYSSAPQNTNSIAGQQLAIRWTDVSVGDSAIIYLDITTTGLDANLKDQWTVKAGDGGGLDIATNQIDISDLTTGTGNYDTLRNGSTFVNAHFSTTLNGFNYPSIQAGPIPEPSTYAAFAGLIALLAVMVKRRRG